jgi:hypothetical protein
MLTHNQNEGSCEMKISEIIHRKFFRRAVAMTATIAVLTAASTRLQATTGTCGGASTTIPFTDVPSGNIFFCAIAEAFFSGLTNGTSDTTYSPSANVSREQMAAFITRTLDQSLRRGSRRAALQRFWRSSKGQALLIAACTRLMASDGEDVWVADPCANSVLRVHASDGKRLETWTNADQAFGVVVLDGTVYITGKTTPGRLYRITSRGNPGDVILVSSDLGDGPEGIAFNGSHLWTANESGSVSRISLDDDSVTTFAPGFSSPQGILFDGSFIWVTDAGDNTLKRVSLDGSVLTSIQVGQSPHYPAFDGMNIWVPNTGSDSVSVVRVKDASGNPIGTPFVVATLTRSVLLDQPLSAAFDGERVCIVNSIGPRVTLWRATDLAFLGSQDLFGAGKFGACSDGVKFWTGDGAGGQVRQINFF